MMESFMQMYFTSFMKRYYKNKEPARNLYNNMLN